MLKNKKLYFSLFFLLLFAFTFGANFVLAANLPEIQYPSIPFSGIETPNQFMQKIIDGVYPSEKALPLYIKYFYYLALVVSGFIILGAIVYGGFQYLISGGNPVKMVDARKQIASSMSGLIILFSSYVILVTINPQLAILSFGAPAVEKCDCSKPVAQLSGYCKTSCQTITLPGETIPTYIEIPIGRIMERVILASKEAYDMASTTNYFAKKLEEKTTALEEETKRCEVCGSIQTTCEGGCSGGYCRINDSTDCPNKTAIDQKSADQTTAINDLKIKRNNLIIASAILQNETTKLELAEATMRDSLTQPISFEEFISIKQARIRKINPWLDVNKENDPLKDIRVQISPNIPGFNGSEDPATFYIPEKENIELIRSIESAFSSILPPPCLEGTTNPYTTCDGESCVTIHSCGASSCDIGSACTSPEPQDCPDDQTRPYTICDGETCRSIDACGASDCAGDSYCSAPPPPPISGACFIPTDGPCNIANLLPYFNNDYSKASKAAQICHRESGGNICALNPGNGLTDEWFANPSCPTCDYSVGLFQLNLLPRCPAGLSYSCSRSSPFTCSVLDRGEVASCRADYGHCDAVANIQQAVRISSNGTNWCPWSTAGPGYCNFCP
ncbi:MAG: hypothetical protein Q7R53_01070 [bacterium]|nr:hypothetical protein [bacterium]